MWVRLSGASKDLIDKTGIFKEKETIKYTCNGQLLLIPATLGTIGAYYAFSTIEENPYFCTFFAIIWFCIIFIIDRTISATMYKSNKNKSNGFYLSIFVRIVLSICVGIVISHPLVLRIFKPEITETMGKQERIERKHTVTSDQDSVDKSSKSYNEQIAGLEDVNECLTRLNLFERSKANTVPTIHYTKQTNQQCGISSGLGSGCGTECHHREDLIGTNNKQIEKIRTEMKEATKGIKAFQDNNINNPILKARSYLSQTDALDVLMNGDGGELKPHHHVSSAMSMLMLFFIFLDCLIVIIKATTPVGAYENAIDLLSETQIKNLAIEEAAFLVTNERIAKLKGDLAFDSFDMLKNQNLLSEVIRQIDASREEFREKQKKWLADVGVFDFKRRKQLKKDILAIEHMYDLVRIKTLNSLSESIAKM
jgi:hypothetical protein